MHFLRFELKCAADTAARPYYYNPTLPTLLTRRRLPPSPLQLFLSFPAEGSYNLVKGGVCLPCPEGASCQGDEVYVMNGFWLNAE